MTMLRAVVFFVALTVLAKAMFAGPSAHLAQALQLRGFAPVLAMFLVHVPFALAIALLGWHARVWGRLPANLAWYVLLLVLAAAHVAIPWYRLSIVVPFVKPALLAAVVLVMLRLTPRIGTVYEATTLPGVRVFLALTLLLGASFSVDDELFRLGEPSKAYYALEKYLRFILPQMVMSAVVVAVFIMASRLRERSLQPTAAGKWMLAGIIVFVAGESLRQVVIHAHQLFARGPAGLPFVTGFAIPLWHLGHALLFVGAFQLFASLLPRRAADELA